MIYGSVILKRFVNVFSENVIFRFLLVGGFNTAFSFGVFTLFVYMGFHYALSNLIALFSGILLSYFTNGKVVFRHLSRAAFYRYVLLWCIIYILQVVIIYFSVYLGWGEIIGGGVALVFAVPSSFLLQRYYVFRC
jgi:putative flippase GtrA